MLTHRQFDEGKAVSAAALLAARRVAKKIAKLWEYMPGNRKKRMQRVMCGRGNHVTPQIQFVKPGINDCMAAGSLMGARRLAFTVCVGMATV
jgi:hypothetical protein